jgi:tripartite-type tricarboxylate transporter receptor subunit TctC
MNTRKKGIYLRNAASGIFLLVYIFIVHQGIALAAPVDFPNKEITVIVNYAAGGGRDNVARGVGKIMAKYLGVPVVVVNAPGAGGATGLAKLNDAAPDGYTLGIGAETDIIDQMMEKRPYDFMKFIFLGRVQSSRSIYYVRSDSPFRSVKDFKTFGKPVRYAIFSLSGTSTVTAMILANRENFPLKLVEGYQSSSETLQATIRGEAEFNNSSLSVSMPFVKSGQVRPLVVVAPNRSPFFPDTPTLGEEGYPDMTELTVNFVFMTPPGVPKDRILILEDALMKTLKDPEFLEWAKKANVELGPLNGEDTTKLFFNLSKIFKNYKGDIEKFMRK